MTKGLMNQPCKTSHLSLTGCEMCVCEQPQSCSPVNGQLCDNVSIFPLHLLYPVSMMMSSRHWGTPSGDMEHRGEEFWWGVWGRKK